MQRAMIHQTKVKGGKKSKIVTQDSDNGSDDMESNDGKKIDRKKKKRKTKIWNKVIMKVKSLTKSNN